MTALAIAVGCVLALLATCGLAIVMLSKSLMIITVTGSSMSPTYVDLQRLLVRRHRRCRRYDVAVFATAEWDILSVPAMLVKRIVAVSGDQIPADMASIFNDTHVPEGMLLVRGDNFDSLDSRRLGYVPASAIIGVVIRPLSTGSAPAA
jgi:signal peptidase I